MSESNIDALKKDNQETYPGENDYKNLESWLETFSPRERQYLIHRNNLHNLIQTIRRVNYKYRYQVNGKWVYPFTFKLREKTYPYLICCECKTTDKIRKIPVVFGQFKLTSLDHLYSDKYKIRCKPNCKYNILCDQCLVKYIKCDCGKYYKENSEQKCLECLNSVTITVNITQTDTFSFNNSNLYRVSRYEDNGFILISITSSKLVFKYKLENTHKYLYRYRDIRDCEYIFTFLKHVLGCYSILLYMNGYSEPLNKDMQPKYIFTPNREYTFTALPDVNHRPSRHTGDPYNDY